MECLLKHMYSCSFICNKMHAVSFQWLVVRLQCKWKKNKRIFVPASPFFLLVVFSAIYPCGCTLLHSIDNKIESFMTATIQFHCKPILHSIASRYQCEYLLELNEYWLYRALYYFHFLHFSSSSFFVQIQKPIQLNLAPILPNRLVLFNISSI